MATKTKVLTVRSLEQAAAWLELDGQISDGFWENARPRDHWRDWCAAEVRVAGPGEQVGRNFWAAKVDYDFASKALLDVVGLRMLSIVRIARRFGLAVARELEHAPACEDGRIDWKDEGDLILILQVKHGVTPNDVDAATADESYSMRDLRADLRDLKQVVRTVAAAPSTQAQV